MIWCTLLDLIYVHNVNASNMRLRLLVDYVYIMLTQVMQNCAYQLILLTITFLLDTRESSTITQGLRRRRRRRKRRKMRRRRKRRNEEEGEEEEEEEGGGRGGR